MVTPTLSFSGSVWHGTSCVQWGFLHVPGICSPHDISIICVCHLLQDILPGCELWTVSWACVLACCLKVPIQILWAPEAISTYSWHLHIHCSICGPASTSSGEVHGGHGMNSVTPARNVSILTLCLNIWNKWVNLTHACLGNTSIKEECQFMGG